MGAILDDGKSHAMRQRPGQGQPDVLNTLAGRRQKHVTVATRYGRR